MEVFVTGNQNKLKEVRAIFATDAAFVLESRELDLPEIQGTTQEVSREKCRRAAEIVGGPVITEDTALCFDALGGLPGAYIKWFLQKLGLEGLNKMLDGFSDRSAVALCTFAYSPGPDPNDPNAESKIVLSEGRTKGSIVPARGPSQFGWDPIFEVEGTGETYGEMDPVKKNLTSHRYKALTLLKDHLRGV